MSTRFLSLVLVVAACGSPDPDAPPDGPPLPPAPAPNPAREVLDTKLAFDITAMTGTATITVGPSEADGATFEVGDLEITSVQVSGATIETAPRTTTTNTQRELDLALPASAEPTEVVFTFAYKTHSGFSGVSPAGFTLMWPYYCGNVFPCHSNPADGTTMALELTGIPAGKQAVFPPMVSEAPSYQLAWSVDAYTELPLGTTDAGTALSVWYRANELTRATTGSQHLVAAFDWLEKNLGPYRFGAKAGSVSVRWGAGALGGMEHHPYWHIGAAAIGDEETHVHEAAHGWYGDGIRIACWEDFVLSEGTTTYLSGRALEVVEPTLGAQLFAGFESELAGIPATDKVWPDGCNEIDILEDDLFTRAPYIRGALFYRALALKVGKEKVDEVLRTFYAAHAGKAARMSEMLTTIQTVTNYDPTTCAEMWLKSTTKPTPGACP
ncbi:MAG: M1 family aminopeptidase [Kofleriaceae bacterium]|nr:M1 family aminopeptidase [Kofleriaceae bacterium]